MAEFDLEITTGRQICMGVELCKGWKNLIFPVTEDYKKQLDDYANRIAKFSGLEKAVLGWDEEWGLSHVEVRPGDRCALLLHRDSLSPRYGHHNIFDPEQAFTLMCTVLKYIRNIRATNAAANNLPLYWDIWPIDIDNYNELWIKIQLHPKWKEIFRCFSKGFRNFIERCAPFLGEGYTDLKEVKFHWDDELGLKSVEAVPGRNGSSLDLVKDKSGFHYLSHNVYLPIQAVALVGAVSKYIEHAKNAEERLFSSL